MTIIKHALQTLLDKQDLSHVMMYELMHQIMSGQVGDITLCALLVALRAKGESVTEITAAVEVMRELVEPIHITGAPIVDTCGTGGDGANTFNISTTASFIVAAAGGYVAKHGNRSVSSRCGSADVLEAAGINLNLGAAEVAQCVHQTGIGFLFAPNYHGAMKYTRHVRQELGIRTLFNLLGPLANPANARHQLIGVFSAQWLLPLAHVLRNLGSQHVVLVSADDGLDEISIASTTQVAELKNGHIQRYTINPEQLGFKRSPLSCLAVTNVSDSLTIMRSVLSNDDSPARDIVLLNAGAAIYAADLAPDLAAAIDIAKTVLANGLAMAKLDALMNYTQLNKTQ